MQIFKRWLYWYTNTTDEEANQLPEVLDVDKFDKV